MLRDNAKNVVSNSSQTNIHKPHVVSAVNILSIEEIGYEDVHNMEVEDNHNFAVNGGLVVHNCMDDLRYFVYTVLRYRKDNVKRLSWMP